MTQMQFTKATKKESRLRMALVGPSGAGKTYSALKMGRGLVGPAGRIAVIDTEHGSASKYADEFEFDCLNLEHHSPQNYVDAIKAAVDAGYDLLIIDSLSHAWSGKGGALEQVDEAKARSRSNNGFVAWRHVTPQHTKLVEAILAAKTHVIATMRAKQEYVQEKDDRGKTQIRKVGLAPIQRDGVEYEFDVVGDIDLDHRLVITKSRCPALSGKSFLKPNGEVSGVLIDWLSGEPVTDEAPPPTEEPKQEAPPPAKPKQPTELDKAVSRFLGTLKETKNKFTEAMRIIQGAGADVPDSVNKIESAANVGPWLQERTPAVLHSWADILVEAAEVAGGAS